jgi:hypothetical protein
MSAMARIARWAAVAIAIAAIVDPAIPLLGRERAAVRVTGDTPADVTRVMDAIAREGFAVGGEGRETLTVLVTDRVPAPPLAPDTWIVDATPGSPNVRIARVDSSHARLPEQAVEVNVVVAGDGVRGKTTELMLENAGIPVASATHAWTADHEEWRARLHYLPASTAAARLTILATVIEGETRQQDNRADVAIPSQRGPVRVLVVEAAVTWPALFVRRALEGESAFAVSATQRAAKGIATRAGDPPRGLTRDTLAGFDAAVIGGPETLTAIDVEALRWFVETRGGIAVLLPDQRPSGAYMALIGRPAFDERTLEAPVKVGADLLASELAVARDLPLTATTLAGDPEGHPVVVSIRRGSGAIVFSGALDAWRYRAHDEEGFARFWRRTLAAHALSVPPALDVTVNPRVVRPGDPVIVTARLRDTELQPGADRVQVSSLGARAIAPGAKVDEPLRLWPSAEPGVFVGEWRPPRAAAYDISVTSSERRGDATLLVAPDVARLSSNPSDLALAARAAGTRSFRLDQLDALAVALATAAPPRGGATPRHPMRSPWWCVPFAALLCAEWAVRRTRGLP